MGGAWWGCRPPQWSPGPNRCGAREASTEALLLPAILCPTVPIWSLSSPPPSLQANLFPAALVHFGPEEPTGG